MVPASQPGRGKKAMTWPSFFHTASIGLLCWLPIGAVLRWRHRGQAFNE
jgi:hypothetical protein